MQLCCIESAFFNILKSASEYKRLEGIDRADAGIRKPKLLEKHARGAARNGRWQTKFLKRSQYYTTRLKDVLSVR
jgi:hypothetical protein